MARVLAIAVCAAAVVTCADPTAQPRGSAQSAQLHISASVASTPVSTLVVIVSAADIQPSLLFNVTIVNGSASGTITVPVGTARTILVRAVDASSVVTHEGSRVVDVRQGNNPNLSIALAPLVGSQPIDVHLGSLLVVVSPSQAVVGQGMTRAFTATVTDLDGNPVTFDPANIRWATFDTRVATVDAKGVVRGALPGTVQVVASSAGSAGAASVSVAPVIVAAGDIVYCTHSDDEATATLLDTIPGTVLPLGDNVYEDGTLAEYTTCYGSSWGRHKARTRPIPGNHEYHIAGAPGYFDYFGALAGDRNVGYYSYDLGSWHILALNSEISVSASSAQVAWLRAELASTTAKCILAYWHKPRYSDGNSHGNNTGLQAMWKVLFENRADIVLSGHDHNYERFALQDTVGVADAAGGLRQFVVGTGGAPLNGFISTIQPTSEFRLQEFGVLRVVLGESSYSWSFIASPSGIVRDSGTTNCH